MGDLFTCWETLPWNFMTLRGWRNMQKDEKSLILVKNEKLVEEVIVEGTLGK